MNMIKIIAIVLIVGGVMGLVYGNFTYTRQTDELKIGKVEISVDEKETVNVPVWAGVSAIAIGGILLLIKK